MSTDQDGRGEGKRPTQLAYTIRKDGEGKGHFNRIGAVFPHKDGKGSDVVLDAVPVNGRLTLRNLEERLDELKAANPARTEKSRSGSYREQ